MAVDKKKIQDLFGVYSIDDLTELSDELDNIGKDDDELNASIDHPLVRALSPKLGKGVDIRDIIRTEILTRLDSEISITNTPEKRETNKQKIFKKRQELYDILDNLDKHIGGKDTEETAAFFSSLLEIISQICIQQTDGVIVVRTRLQDYIDPAAITTPLPREFVQELDLLFSTEEIVAMHARLPHIDEKDPFKPMLTAILEKSYDMVRFNEMSGNLLIFMTKYFIDKLKEAGLEGDAKFVELTQRHDRSRSSFGKALHDLKILEDVLRSHAEQFPVIEEFHKYIRALLQIKAGLIDHIYAGRIIATIKKRGGEYARARKAVLFDFNKLPHVQHELHLRQSVIISLQKDTLEYTVTHLEEEFASVKKEFDRMLDDIEVASNKLNPSSDEYQNLLSKKTNLNDRMEQSRKKLDVVHSQFDLVDVQHQLVKEAIQRFKEQEKSMSKEAQQIRPTAKIQTRSTAPKQNKQTRRMVMARNLR